MFFLGGDRLEKLGEYVEFLDRHEINTVHTTPSFFREVLRARRVASESGRWKSLKLLHFGGEKLTQRFVSALGEFVPEDCEIYNGYGPTETTINATIYRHTKGRIAASHDSLPVGRATAGNRTYVLDEHFHLVGGEGELYIGGEGVARGYVHGPELTAERFLPDPFSNVPGARMYRTGDRVRPAEGGNLVFLGRLDHQIKIRGYRVEAGEIEAVLAQQPDVAEAVVLAGEKPNGESELLSFVAPRSGAMTEGDDLRVKIRGHLKARLPEYMLPTKIIFLSTLPLGSSGKVNMQELKDLARRDGIRASNGGGDVVHEMFCAALGVRDLGDSDSFFEHGGHSLLAARLITDLRGRFGVRIPYASFFTNPSIAGVRKMLQAAQTEESDEPKVERETYGDLIPVCHSQLGFWLYDQIAPEKPTAVIPVAIRMKGRLDTGALKAALSELVMRHESLRTTFELSKGGELFQRIGAAPEWSPEFDDISNLTDDVSEKELVSLTDKEMRRPFDLVNGPIFRAKIVRIRKDDHMLILNMHHAVSDAVSVRLINRDLSGLYRAHVLGGERPPPPPFQYGDYCAWQRRILRGSTRAKLEAYWKKKLANLPVPLLDLAMGKSRPHNPSPSAGWETRPLSEDLYARIAEFAGREGASVFVVMLTVFFALLKRYTGKDDLSVATFSANRDRKETDNVVGAFVNTLILRTDLSGDPGFRPLLANVREVAWEAFANQDIPLELVFQALDMRRERILAMPSLVAFTSDEDAYYPGVELELPGVETSFPDMDIPNTGYDMIVFLNRSREGRVFRVQYRREVFDEQAVCRMVDHYFNILERSLSDPECRISQYDLLTEGEKANLDMRSMARDGEAFYEDISEVFSRIVRQDPDAEAVRAGDEIMSRRDLERGANMIAKLITGEEYED